MILLVTPVMLYFSTGVEFDSDLMNLNYLSPELKKAQQEISAQNSAALSSVFVIAEGRDGEEALQKLETVSGQLDRLSSTGLTSAISNPSFLLPSVKEQQRRLSRWNSYWTESKIDSVLAHVVKSSVAAGYSPTAFAGFWDMLTGNHTTFDRESTELLRSLYPGGFAKDSLAHYAIASLRVTTQNRQAVFRQLSEFEDVLVTDRQQGAGQLVDILKDNFTDIAIYSSLIVFVALLLGYGRIELTIMSFLPMAISWIWILGLMALLGLKFNIVNVIISSLIFGLGDDYTIFTMDGLVDRYKTGKEKLTSARAAVYVSAVTVVIGLGVLLLAKHPALRSIALISVIGLLCVLFISQTLQPLLFKWFIQNRADKRYLPFTLHSLLVSVFAFSYFFIGSMLLTVLGVVLTRLWPFGKDKGRYHFHAWLTRMAIGMRYIMVNVKKRIYNSTELDYREPAIYIANHSSFLDILLTISLHPRLILLTNKWVWHSPVFGAVVRMAEYYPVADGAEESIRPLEDLVQRGYSILVFPEGTRSYDGKIGRFHKGAFYLAERLRLKIVPVLMHGVGYTMQKGDWLLKDGTCSIHVYPAIEPADTTYGATYSDKAKYIGRWMREQLREKRVEYETPSYFREQLLRTYTYKGPVLEWYCRIKTALEKNYEVFHTLLPREGRFYDLGCGYGFMTYMLHWSAPGREFIGMDYDEEKIETAQNNSHRDDSIRFEHADVTRAELQPCDGIIITDVLHYLLPHQQIDLLEKCAAALVPGGVLIIRDGVSELTERIKRTKLTELFSTKLLGFNKTQNNLNYISRAMISDFAQRHSLSVEVLDHAKVTANLTFVLRR